MQNINKAKNALSDLFLRLKNIFKPIRNSAFKHKEFDKKLVLSLSKSRVPSLKQIKYVKKFLSGKELLIIYICLAILLVNTGIVAVKYYKNHFQPAPKRGGSYAEGLVGVPQYVNPLYAGVSDVDNDIASLVFSSLLKRDGNGQLVKDLADSYSANKDGKIYKFTIKQGVKWHDASDLTVDDIVFTFNIIKDKQYNSPLRVGFGGVEIKKLDGKTVEFDLADSYAAFLELMDFGILPQAQWGQIPPNAANLAELNLKPIGSGPYKFKSLVKDKNGNIRSYNLAVNEDYYGKIPFIEELNFKFFPDFESAIAALNSGNTIDAISYLPNELSNSVAAQDHLNYFRLNMPQLTSLFFNEQANSAVNDKKIRQAMSMAIDKNKLVEKVFGNSTRVISGPILPDSFAYSGVNKYNYNQDSANRLLDSAGWQIKEITKQDIASAGGAINDPAVKKSNEIKLAMGVGKWRMKNNEYLVVKLTAVNNQENGAAAEMIKFFWEDIGIKTKVELVSSSQVQSEIIKQRNFTVLLYNVVTGADPDPYALWHSSQAGSGLNLTGFLNKEADQLLEDARLANNIQTRKEKYKRFQEIIAEETPAIFLCSQTYNYVQSKKIKGFGVKNILLPRDRFNNIGDWYVNVGEKFTW